MSAKSCKSESNVRNMSEESTHGIPPEKKLRSVQAVCLTQVESQPSPQVSNDMLNILSGARVKTSSE